MNLRRIIFCLIAVLCIFSIVFSVIDLSTPSPVGDTPFDNNAAFSHIQRISDTSRPYQSSGANDVYGYIVSTLNRFRDESAAGVSVQVVESSFQLDYQTNHSFGSNGTYNLFEPQTVKNVLVEIISQNGLSQTSAANVLVLCHYDSSPNSFGAYDNGIGVAVMLEQIRIITQQAVPYLNRIAFAFVDGAETNLIGSNLYANLIGNDSPSTNYEAKAILDRTRFVINIDSAGHRGSVVMYETSVGNYKTIKQFVKSNKNIYANSAYKFIYSPDTDFSPFKQLNIQGLNFVNVAGRYTNHTIIDSTQGYNKNLLAQFGENLYRSLDNFGNTKLTDLYLSSSNNNAVFFTLFDAAIAYSKITAMVIAVISVFVIAAAIVISINKNRFDIKLVGLLKGAAVQILSIVCTVFAVWLISLMFRIFPNIGALVGSHTFENTAMTLGFCLIAVSLCMVAFKYLSKLFNVDKHNVSLANSAIYLLCAFVTGMFFAEISFMFSIIALFEAVAFLVLALVNQDSGVVSYRLNILARLVMLPFYVGFPIVIVHSLGFALISVAVVPILLYLGNMLPFVSALPEKQFEFGKTKKYVFKLRNILVYVLVFVIGFASVACGAVYNDGALKFGANLSGTAGDSISYCSLDYVVNTTNGSLVSQYYSVTDKNAYRHIKQHTDLFKLDKNLSAYVYSPTDRKYTPSSALPTVEYLNYANTSNYVLYQIKVTPLDDGDYTLIIPNDNNRLLSATVIDSDGKSVYYGTLDDNIFEGNNTVIISGRGTDTINIYVRPTYSVFTVTLKQVLVGGLSNDALFNSIDVNGLKSNIIFCSSLELKLNNG